MRKATNILICHEEVEKQGFSRNTLKRLGSSLRKAAYVSLGILVLAGRARLANGDVIWEVEFTNSLSGYNDRFFGSMDSEATDGYEITHDLLQPPAPPSGGVKMISIVDGWVLTKDCRGNFPNTWNIILAAEDNLFVGFTGTNKIIWDYFNVPEPIYLLLNDYGTDSTRTNLIASINLRNNDEYVFYINNALYIYRYLELEAHAPEPSTLGLIGAGGLVGLLSIRKKRLIRLAWQY